MGVSFTHSEVWDYFATILPLRGQTGRAEYRGPCPNHKGRNNNFVVDAESGLSFCFSKCNRGWDMIGLDQQLFGGDRNAARRRVFAAIGRRIDEPSAVEAAALAEQRKQDHADEAIAYCWRRGFLQHIERQLAQDKAHLFSSDLGDRRAARIQVKHYSNRQRQLEGLSRSELLAEFRAMRSKNAQQVEHWAKAGAEDLEDCRIVCVAIVRMLELSVSQSPSHRVEKLGGSK